MCEAIKIGESVAIICRGRGHKRQACHYCGHNAPILCDFPVGKHRNGRKKTCDIKLCDDCAQSGISKDVHFCRSHYPLAKAAYERRTGTHVLETVV